MSESIHPNAGSKGTSSSASFSVSTSHNKESVAQEIKKLFIGHDSSHAAELDKNALLLFQERMKRSVALADKYIFPARYFFNCSHADILAANVRTLEEMALEKLGNIEQDNLEESQKKITKVVRLLLPMATHPHVRKPLMLALSKLKNVNPGFLSTIAGCPELYQHAPVNVIRQLWMEDEEVHQLEIRECVTAYEAQWLNRISQCHLVAPLLHESTSSRRSLKQLIRLAYGIGNSRKLYQQTLAYIRKRCRSESDLYLSALRIDIFMCVREMHRRSSPSGATLRTPARLASANYSSQQSTSSAIAMETNTDAVSDFIMSNSTAFNSLGWLAQIESLGGGFDVRNGCVRGLLNPEKDPSENDPLGKAIWLLDYSVNNRHTLSRMQTQQLCQITRDIIRAKESHAWDLSRVYRDSHVQYLLIATILRAIFRIRHPAHLPRNSNRVKFLVEALMMSVRHSVSETTEASQDGGSAERKSLSQRMIFWQKTILCDYLPLIIQFNIAVRRFARKVKLVKLNRNKVILEEKHVVPMSSALLQHQLSPFLLQYVILVALEDGNWIMIRSVLTALVKHIQNKLDDGSSSAFVAWRVDCVQSITACIDGLKEERRRTSLLSLFHDLLTLHIGHWESLRECDNNLSGGGGKSNLHSFNEFGMESSLLASIDHLHLLYARVVLALPRTAYLEERKTCCHRLQTRREIISTLNINSESLLNSLEDYINKLSADIMYLEEIAQAFSPTPKTIRGPQFTPMPSSFSTDTSTHTVFFNRMNSVSHDSVGYNASLE